MAVSFLLILCLLKRILLNSAWGGWEKSPSLGEKKCKVLTERGQTRGCKGIVFSLSSPKDSRPGSPGPEFWSSCQKAFPLWGDLTTKPGLGEPMGNPNCYPVSTLQGGRPDQSLLKTARNIYTPSRLGRKQLTSEKESLACPGVSAISVNKHLCD